jgi:hypothetical protein
VGYGHTRTRENDCDVGGPESGAWIGRYRRVPLAGRWRANRDPRGIHSRAQAMSRTQGADALTAVMAEFHMRCASAGARGMKFTAFGDT